MIIGIVILVIGIVLAGISVAESASNVRGSGTAMYSGKNGDYYSNSLSVTTKEEITVVSNVNSYLIPSQDLSVVNSSNIASYKILPSESAGNTSLYSGLNGSYYVVTFGPTSPKVEYATLNVGIGLVVIAALLVVGALLVVVGIILAIIGAVIRPKKGPQNQF